MCRPVEGGVSRLEKPREKYRGLCHRAVTIVREEQRA